jgi:hypothetical protein
MHFNRPGAAFSAIREALATVELSSLKLMPDPSTIPSSSEFVVQSKFTLFRER